jgi:hypothetical protein
MKLGAEIAGSIVSKSFPNSWNLERRSCIVHNQAMFHLVAFGSNKMCEG